VAVVLDLKPGASADASAGAASWTLPIPQLVKLEPPAQPMISS
jgi:hypothetical protein